MPPVPKVTKEEIINAALNIVRKDGAASLTIRQTALQLHVSTQPVMSHFKTAAALKEAVFDAADRYHKDYLFDVDLSDSEEATMKIGLNFVRFARDEPNLFRFLFFFPYKKTDSLRELLSNPDLNPVLQSMEYDSGIPEDRLKRNFSILAVYVHGYACLVAANSLNFREEELKNHMECQWFNLFPEYRGKRDHREEDR